MNMALKQRLLLLVRLLFDAFMSLVVLALIVQWTRLAFTLHAWPVRIAMAVLAVGLGVTFVRVVVHRSAQWRAQVGTLLQTH